MQKPYTGFDLYRGQELNQRPGFKTGEGPKQRARTMARARSRILDPYAAILLLHSLGKRAWKRSRPRARAEGQDLGRQQNFRHLSYAAYSY